MTNMRPPQHGQGWASGCAAAGSISTALRPQALPAPEFARSRDRLGTVRAGEQAVVADAMEALGQNVNEKPADELADIECHRRVQAGAFDPVVFDLEHDAVLVDRDQTAVRAGVAVGISRQIGEYGLRARERTLGVDEPALLAERGEECRERLRIDKMRVSTCSAIARASSTFDAQITDQRLLRADRAEATVCQTLPACPEQQTSTDLPDQSGSGCSRRSNRRRAASDSSRSADIFRDRS